MRLLLNCTAIVGLLITAYLPESRAQWVPAGSPLGHNIYALASSGKDVFASDGSYIYLSTDSGKSWNITGRLVSEWEVITCGKQVNVLGISGTNLFAGITGCMGGVFVSTNKGVSWAPDTSGLSGLSVYSLVFSGTTLIAGGSGWVDAYRSTDNGHSWTPSGIGTPNTAVRTLVVSGTSIFAGTSGGVYVSTNDGVSWTRENTGILDPDILALAVSGSQLFAGSSAGRVFRSPNGGKDWTLSSAGLGEIFYGVYSLTVFGTDVIAGTSDGIYRSTDNGATWGLVNRAMTYCFAVSGEFLLAGVASQGVLLSSDSGTTWKYINTGLGNDYVY